MIRLKSRHSGIPHVVSYLVISLLVGLIRFYQIVLSPLHGPVCRFQPTCSEYFDQVLHKKGVFKGVYYGLRRLLRCRPLGGSGYDPVP